MACWITDGSTGFTIDGNVVTHVDDKGIANVFNALWQEGDGESSGKHYWKIELPTLVDGVGVGFTSNDRFKKGYACKAIIYSGNLSNCGARLVGSFGPEPKQRDVIGLLVVFEEERLKVYIDVNGISLGLAFNVPASTFSSIFPVVSFHKSGSAICTKQTEIPNITNRAPATFKGVEGDWKLTNLNKNGEAFVVPRWPTAKITKNEMGKYSWHVHAYNNLGTSLLREDGCWKTLGFCSTMMLGPPEEMKVERAMGNLMDEAKVFQIDESGNLYIKSDELSSTWVRYDSAPGPFVGDPFA